MKQETADTFVVPKPGEPARGGERIVAGLRDALASGDGPAPSITLVGHSTGAVYIDNLLSTVDQARRTQQDGLPADFTFRNIVFLAPACTIADFDRVVRVHEDLWKHFRMFTMDDAHERQDRLVPVIYPHSLLYLVSGLLERDAGGRSEGGKPLVGLQRWIQGQARDDDPPEFVSVRAFIGQNATAAVWSPSNGPSGLSSGAMSHGAFDDDAEVRSEPARDHRGDLDGHGRDVRRRGRHRNRTPAIRDLSKPRADAEGFNQWLISRAAGGFRPRTCCASTAEQPDRSRRSADALGSRPRGDESRRRTDPAGTSGLDAALANDPLAWSDSRLYIYASGHGIAPNVGVGALLFADSDPSSDYWDSVEFGDFRDYYESSGRFREVVFFADCCRERRVLAPTLRPQFTIPTQKYGSADWILGFASEYGDQAFEPPDHEVDLTRGYYTQALIDGLEGGAADRATGEIRSDALGRYVQTSVMLYTSGTKYHQIPKLAASDAANPMVIRPGLHPLPRKKRPMEFVFPAGFQGVVELTVDGTSEPEHWNAANGPWRIEVEEGICVVRTVGDGGSPNPLPSRRGHREGAACRARTSLLSHRRASRCGRAIR